MRALLCVALLVSTPATAATCPQNRAVYVEPDNGYQLRFRPTLPWEAPSNTSAILELRFPDGVTTLWGTTWLPNGTSHDRARLHDGCQLPGKEENELGSSEDELTACQVWDGVILALVNNDIAALPWDDTDAPAATILLPDLGPTIRYSGLVMSPGDEPHDVFTLSGCAE